MKATKIQFSQLAKKLFHCACDSNNIELVKLFFDHANELGIDLNARSPGGKTPVMYAVKPEVMKLILDDARIDVNATDDLGHTALYHLFRGDFIWSLI